MYKTYLFNTGISNLLSVDHALKKLNYDVVKIDNFIDIEEGCLVVVPGVGHFDNIMNKLSTSNFKKTDLLIKEKKIFFLGICLGMQILFENSEEGTSKGLGYFEGSVRKLSNRFNGGKHISTNVGWKNVQIKNSTLDKFNNNQFYFVHQYEAIPRNERDIFATTTLFDQSVAVGVKKDNVCGIQFHPEKSGTVGLEFLDFLIKDFCG